MSRSCMAMIASALAALLVASGAGAHGGSMTADEHSAEDSVVHTAGQELALDAHTRAVSATHAKAATAAAAGAPQDVGQWGPVVDWPVVGVHVALLSNGKVLAYDSVGDNATETYPVQDHTRGTVWDPATGAQTPVNVATGYNIFCSGLAHLPDGRVFVAGGNKDQQLNGIVQTHLFDPASDLWSLGPNMAAGRWYPTVTPLNNGEMLITSGRVDTPEVRTVAGSLRALGTASLSLPLYPWLDIAPNGLAFYSGPDPTLRTLNTAGTGTWQAFAQRDSINRDYGSHALYDIGKVLVAGGGPSTKTSLVIDINGATPQVSATAPMAFGRRQHNLTVLADGTVLASAGTRRAHRSSTSTPASTPPSSGAPPPASGGRSRQCRSRVSTTRARCSSPTGASFHRAAESAARATRSATSQERRALLAAVPLPGRRDARSASVDRRGAGANELRRADGDRNWGPDVDPQGRARPARGCHALEQHGTALRAALVHCQRDDDYRYRARDANVAPPGFYMLFIVDSSRRALGGQHGQRRPQKHVTDGDAYAADRQRDVRGARHDQPRCDGVRPRRHRDEGRVLQRLDKARRGHSCALHLHVE